MNTILSLCLLLNITLTGDIKLAGVTFKERVQVNNHNFILNGAGLKTKWILDLYVAGLYVQKKTKDPSEIINSDQPLVLKIVVTSSWVTVKNFRTSVDTYFNHSMKGKIGPIKDRIELFKNAFGDDLKIFDEIHMIYEPKIGIKVFKNGNYKAVIPGLDFKKELAKLWLGDNPASKDLKNGLLGIVED